MTSKIVDYLLKQKGINLMEGCNKPDRTPTRCSDDPKDKAKVNREGDWLSDRASIGHDSSMSLISPFNN